MNSHHREFKTLRWFILVIVASKEWIQEDKNCLTTEHTTQVQSIWVVSSFWSVHNLLALYLKKKMTFGRVQKASFYTSVYRFWPICGRLGLKSTASRSIWLFLRQSLAPGSGGKVVATSHFIFRNPPTHSDPQWWCVWYTVCCVFVFLCIIVYCAEKFWDSYTKKVEFGKILALAITKSDLFFAQ